MENLRLAQEVQRLRQDIDTEELQRLGEDVAGLRDELLAQGDQVKRLQSTPTVSAPAPQECVAQAPMGVKQQRVE